MFSKNKILIGSFVFFAIIISLFPPFYWGNEEVKQYDFLFNNIRKSIEVDGWWRKLERHLIISELFIEYLIAFFMSVFIQIIYNLFKKPVIYIFSFFFACLPVFLFILLCIHLISPLFEPKFEPANLIERKCEKYLSQLTLDHVKTITKNLQPESQNDWGSYTSVFWDSIKTSVKLEDYEYPNILNYLEKSKGRWDYLMSWNEPSILDKETDERILKYREFQVPEGYYVKYSDLLSDIERIKIHRVFVSLSKYEEYRLNSHDYWTKTLMQFRLYSIIISFIITLLIFYTFRKQIIQWINILSTTPNTLKGKD